MKGTENGSQVCNIVLADDCEDDRYLLRRFLERSQSPLCILAECINGHQVIGYLSGKGDYTDRKRFPIPDILILDEVMPIVSGSEVVEWLRDHHQPGMKTVVLTGSDHSMIEALRFKVPDVLVLEKSALKNEITDLVRKILNLCGENVQPASPSQ